MGCVCEGAYDIHPVVDLCSSVYHNYEVVKPLFV